MPDHPVFRFTAERIPQVLRTVPFLAWASSRSWPYLADARTGLLYRGPEHQGSPLTTTSRLSANGRELVSAYQHMTSPGQFSIDIVASTPGGNDQRLVKSVVATARVAIEVHLDSVAGTVVLGVTTMELGPVPTGEQRGGRTYRTQLLLDRSYTGLEVLADLPWYDPVGGDDETSPVQPSPDGATLAVSSAYRTPERTDPRTPRALWSLALWSTTTGEQLIDHPWLLLSCTRAWNPAGTHLLVGDASPDLRGQLVPRILELTTGSLTSPPGLPPATYMLPRTRFHRILGWAGNEHIVTAYKAGRTYTLNLVELATGDVEPVATIHNDVYTWFQIAALTPDEWRNLRDLPA